MLTQVVLVMALLVFYLGPWCPFWIGAFYADGWLKLLLVIVGFVGPLVQAIVLARFAQSD